MKNEDDLTPLPDPFPLPKYYRVDVQEALESGKMTAQTMSSFLSSVASSMYVYKRYPTRDDYITVARSVVQKYQFLASPVGTPHVSNEFVVSNNFILDYFMSSPNLIPSLILFGIIIGCNCYILDGSFQTVSQTTCETTSTHHQFQKGSQIEVSWTYSVSC